MIKYSTGLKGFVYSESMNLLDYQRITRGLPENEALVMQVDYWKFVLIFYQG